MNTIFLGRVCCAVSPFHCPLMSILAFLSCLCVFRNGGMFVNPEHLLAASCYVWRLRAGLWLPMNAMLHREPHHKC